MNDDFDRRDWAEDLNQGVRNRETWFRGLKTLVLLVVLAVLRFVLIAIALYQFVFALVRNRPSSIARPLGPWLARYIEKIILFVTWNSDEPPFPFAPLGEIMADDAPGYGSSSYYAQPDDYDEARYDSAPPVTPDPEPVEAEEYLPEEEAADTGEDADFAGEEEEPGDDDQPGQPPRPDA